MSKDTEKQNTPNLKIMDASDVATEHEEVVPEVREIFEVKNYVDNDGRTIMARFPIDGSNPSFMGAFMVNTQMGPIRLNMDFGDVLDLEECFESFDALAEETVQKAQDEANAQSKIITPDQMRRGPQIIT